MIYLLVEICFIGNKLIQIVLFLFILILSYEARYTIQKFKTIDYEFC